MKKTIWLFSILGCVFLTAGVLLIFISGKPSKNVKGASTGTLTITRVIDGDTAVASDGRHIRFLGINTSEKGESYSLDAKKLNEKLTLDKPVRLEYEQEEKDRYGRTLAYVFVGDVFINEQIIASGLAITDFMQKNMKYESVLTDAQNSAKENCLGMWEGLCKDPLSKCIKISDIHYDAEGSDETNKNGEWITFENICSKIVSLNNFLLKDSSSSNRYTFKNISLNSSQSLNLHSGCGKDTGSDIFWSCPQPDYSIWNNSHDHAYLYNSTGVLVADYEY